MKHSICSPLGASSLAFDQARGPSGPILPRRALRNNQWRHPRSTNKASSRLQARFKVLQPKIILRFRVLQPNNPFFWDPHSSARTTHAGQEVSRGLYLTKGCKRIRQEKQSELPRQCVASWKEKRHDKDKGRYPSMNHHGNTCRSSSEIPNDVMQ